MRRIILLILALSLLGASGFAGGPSTIDHIISKHKTDSFHSTTLTRPQEDQSAEAPSEILTGDQKYHSSEVNKYISEVLKADPEPFNLSYRDRELVSYADSFFDKADSANQDARVIQEIAQNMMLSEYGNVSITAKAGRGKSHLIPMINMVFAYGAMPEHVKKILQLDNPILKKFYDEYLGNTQIIYVSSSLVGKDNTAKGEAFAKADERMKQVVAGLYAAAEKDGKSERHLKTFFMFDEVALLTKGTLQSMKVPLDKSGFKDPKNELQRKLDSGTHTIAMTTPGEREEMIRGDTALERRMPAIRWRDMNEEQAMSVLKDFSLELKAKWGVDVDDEALGYLISLNNYIYSQPMAMPASVKRALENLVIWFGFNGSENGKRTRITLLDSQKWFIKQVGLSEKWLPGPNGEPPLYKMSENIEKEYIGDKSDIRSYCRPLEVYGRLGNPGRFPTLFFGGKSGVGKNTVIEAIYNFLYDTTGAHQHYSIGASTGKSFEELFEGTRPSGDSPGKLPLIIQNRENGNAPVGLVLDEGLDAPSKVFDDLKVFAESGIVQPVSKDNNLRFWMHPVAILGQWGQEKFEDLTDEEIAAKRKAMTQKEIDEAFTNPKNAKEGRGVVSQAFLDRAKVNGGVFIVPPTPKSRYIEIVNLHAAKIIVEQKKLNNLDITISDSLKEKVVSQTIQGGENGRGLVSNLYRLTLTAISEGAAQETKGIPSGTPLKNAKLNLTVDENGVVVSSEGENAKKVHLPFQSLFDGGGCDVKLGNLRK